VVIGWQFSPPFSKRLVATRYTVQIVPQVRGPIEKLHAEPLVPIKKGDILFEIQKTPFQFTVDQLTAELAAAKQSILQLGAGVQAADAGVERAGASLLASQAAMDVATETQKLNPNAIGQLEVTQLTQQFEAAKASVDQSKAATKQASYGLQAAKDKIKAVQAQLNNAQFNLEQCTVRASADGFVVNWQVREGTMTATLPMSAVGTFVDSSSTNLVATFGQNTVKNVEAGDAVEIEGNQIYVAGAVPQGVSVRVYIDNEFIGLTRGTSDNRFLVSNVFNLTEGEHAVRADVVDSTDGSVLSRAEVPLVHEVPKEPVPQTEVAAASPEPAPAQLVAEPSVSEPQKQEINPISQKPVEVAAKPASEPVSTAQSEVQVANSEQKPEPTSPTVAETSATAAPEPVEEEPVGVAVEPAAKIDEPASVEPKLSVKQPENDTTVVVQPKADTPVAPTETADNAPPEQTQPVSVPAKRAPTVIRTGRAVIIKRGDNLWRISRKTYGLGIRYTTIYNANRNQIRNPHRIYVGQIFKIPEKAEQEG